jgi:hypothetical protein
LTPFLNTNAFKDFSKNFEAKNGRKPTLSEIAKEESGIIKKELDKKRDKNDPCAKGIKKALKDFKNLPADYFDKLMKEALKHCKNK